MDLFEFENERFGKDLWTKEAIEECRRSKPVEGSGTSIDAEPSPYHFWQGSRLPQWM